MTADGSSEYHVYYNRNYYLVNFLLDGGYGVEPIYALGNDMFSVKDNIVVFPDGNWLTNKVYYNSSTGEFRQLDLDSSIEKYTSAMKFKYSKPVNFSKASGTSGTNPNPDLTLELSLRDANNKLIPLNKAFIVIPENIGEEVDEEIRNEFRNAQIRFLEELIFNYKKELNIVDNPYKEFIRMYNNFISEIKENEDYTIDEENQLIILTDSGMAKAVQ